MKLVGYTRVSSDSQADNTSLEEQHKRIKSYCDAMGHELIETFEEVGSGKNTEERPQFNKALNALNDKGDGIIALKLDRIARSTRDVLTLVEDSLQPENKALVLLDLNVDTSTPTGKMILSVMASVAELERHKINERTQGGRKAKADKGGYAYGSPRFGYTSNENKELEENEEEQEIIEIIRKHHKAGKSLRKIANYLNENGYRSKQGKDWKHTSVKSVLNKIYKK